MKLRTFALLGFVSLGAGLFPTSPVSAQEPENRELARRLVERAQLNEMAALGVRLSVRRAVADGKATQAFLECVSSQDSRIFDQPISSVYANGLSHKELAEALSFFDGPVGQKYVSYTRWGTEKYAGFVPTSPLPLISNDEMKSIHTFVSSSVGKQMSGANSVLALSTQKELAKVVEPMLISCRH